MTRTRQTKKTKAARLAYINAKAERSGALVKAGGSLASMASSVENRPTSPSIKPPGTPPGDEKPQGSDGVSSYGGYISVGETHPDLIGENLWRTYAKILGGTIIVAAAVRYALNLIGGVTWTAEPNPHAKDQRMAKKCAELVGFGLLDADMPLPWQMHAKKAALYRWYGFSLHNWIMRTRSDGVRVFADLQHRPQQTIKQWDIPAEGMPWVGVIQQTRTGGLYYVERSRSFYCVDLSITDQPAGVGLLRHVAEHARRLERAEQIEAYGYDANLRGVPLCRAPLAELYNYAVAHPELGDPDAYVDDQVHTMDVFLKNHVKSSNQGYMMDSAVYLSNDTAGATPSGTPKWAIELLKGDDMSLAEAAQWIERINREIARVLSAEYMLLGDGDAGSNAMHTDKTAQQGAMLNATLGEIAAFARNDLARPLVARNFGAKVAEDCTPIITPSPICVDDLRVATGAMLDMVNAGAYVPPDDPAWAVLRDRGALPPPMRIPPAMLGALQRVPRQNIADNGGSTVVDPNKPPPPTDPNKPQPPSTDDGGKPKPGTDASNAPADQLRAGGEGAPGKQAA
jgi:hypothetical protein